MIKLNLLVQSPGKCEGKLIPIASPHFVIGRGAGCQLRASFSMISRQHCVLQTRGNQAWVQDCGSTNGTFVNGEKISSEHELLNNDQIEIGPFLFKVQLELTSPTNVPAQPLLLEGSVDSEAATMLSALS